jgi:hypothetical protein
MLLPMYCNVFYIKFSVNTNLLMHWKGINSYRIYLCEAIYVSF